MGSSRTWFALWLWIAGFAWGDQEPLSQNFSWDPVGYASAYRLEIRSADGVVFDQTGAATSYRLTLGAGTYRWRITVYNLLGKPESTGDWQPLEILKAVRPEILEVSSWRLVGLPSSLTLEGKGLTAETKVFLVNQDHEGTLSVPSQVVAPGILEVAVGADVGFGSYTIRVQNPGGLTSSGSKTLAIVPPAWFHGTVSAGWVGTLPWGDRWYTSTWDQGFYPLGTGARVGLTLAQNWPVVPGVRLGAAWLLSSGTPGAVKFTSDARRLDLQVTAGSTWGPWGWEAGAGGGLNWISFTGQDETTSDLATIAPTLTAFVGGRMQLVAPLWLTVELGASDVLLDSQQALSLHPEVGVSWSF